MITLSEYARKINVSYKTAWRHLKRGLLRFKRTVTGRILVEESGISNNTLIYVCDSSDKRNQDKINASIERCRRHHYNVLRIVKNASPEMAYASLEEAFKSDEWDILFVGLGSEAQVNVKRLFEILLLKINKKIIWI